MNLKSTLLVALTTGILSGCASLLSVSAPVLAMLEDDLFTGVAVGYASGTGTIDVVSTINPAIKCVGSFAYTGTKVGRGEMKCNDGNAATFQFNGLTMASGYGYGSTTRGGMSFTFGLTTNEAVQYLKLPKGKTLKETAKDKRARLVDV